MKRNPPRQLRQNRRDRSLLWYVWLNYLKPGVIALGAAAFFFLFLVMGLSL